MTSSRTVVVVPEQLLAPAAANPERDGQEPEAGRREAIDLTALRALRGNVTVHVSLQDTVRAAAALLPAAPARP
jgi:hypothetical protein